MTGRAAWIRRPKYKARPLAIASVEEQSDRHSPLAVRPLAIATSETARTEAARTEAARTEAARTEAARIQAAQGTGAVYVPV